MKQLLCTAPVLAYPQFGPGHQFTLETDASLEGLGAVLSQADEKGQLHPVAYASHALHKHEQNYTLTELEMVWAVKYFTVYILGHPCVVWTDHTACTSLQHTTHPPAKLARYPGDGLIKALFRKTNLSVDALSRNPVPEAVVAAVEAVSSEYREEQYHEPEFKAVIDYLKEGILPQDDKEARKIVLRSDNFDVIDGLLHYENPNFPGRWCVAGLDSGGS